MDLRPDNWVSQLRRPLVLDPPDGRKLDASYSLDSQSLNSLKPGTWLDDSVINTFFRSLCFAQPGQFVTFDSAALESLRGAQADIDQHYQTLRTQAATVTANAGLVFMPFCVDSHWVLAVADFRHRIIRIYDSLVTRDPRGEGIRGSYMVEMILPIVKNTLSFCRYYEDQWDVDLMWLPILPNGTDCGVYICLMALQHAYMRGFTHLDYVDLFWHEDEYPGMYRLGDSYFLAGRLVILQVCRRFFREEEDLRGTWDVENRIIWDLQQHLVGPPARQPVPNFITYHEAQFRTLDRVSGALLWFIYSIEKLGSPQSLQENEDLQVRASEVVLSEAGEPFRQEIAHESRLYAWHDAEAAINFRHDLLAAYDHLIREVTYARDRLATRAACEAGLARAEVPTGYPQSNPHLGTPVSPELEESETES